MNPIQKILNPLIIRINTMLDGMDKRKVESIKQSFYLIVLILAIIFGLVGYFNGKNAARKSGIPLIDSTNQLFDLDVMRDSEEGNFDDLLEMEKGAQTQDPSFPMEKFMERGELPVRKRDNVLEPDRLRPDRRPGSLEPENKPLDAARTDDRPVESPVDRLTTGERRAPSSDDTLRPNSPGNLDIRSNPDQRTTPRQPASDETDDIRSMKSGQDILE